MASEKPLTVCYVSTAFHPVYTGAGILFQQYAPGFDAQGIKLTVFTRVPDKNHSSFEHYRDLAKNDKFLPVETVDGVNVQRVNLPLDGGTGWQNQMAFIRAFVEYCRNPETRPDVIQTTYLSEFWLPWLVMLRQMDIPHVYMHSLLAP
ncbi:MAG: glycosyltransferase, partial [Anaerolineae bacterium]